MGSVSFRFTSAAPSATECELNGVGYPASRIPTGNSLPFSPPAKTVEGALIAPVADLVRMKLASFRLKDRVHLQDMDGVGLITPEIEAGLPEILRRRLAEVRASD